MLETPFERVFKKFFIYIILIYKSFGSTHLGGCCRFEPSCSEYALLCYKRFHFLKASKLIFFRLLSCRPFGNKGFDPVPNLSAEN